MDYKLILHFKMFRKSIGITQIELAQKSGLNRNIVSRFETGGNIKIESLMKMLKVLGLKLVIIED